MKPRLALFDLDHTLLNGDSDVLWCDFLLSLGLLEATSFAQRNADMEARYRAGTVGIQEFADFYVGTLAGRSPAQWQPLRQRYFEQWIQPRIPSGAYTLVRQHQEAGATVVLTTATNRFITELTARHLGFEHLIATETQQDSTGTFTGQTQGVLNMRAGKVQRLDAWLAERQQHLAQFESWGYSDSINDLPLLRAVNHACAVNPDAALLAQAQERGWAVMQLV